MNTFKRSVVFTAFLLAVCCVIISFPIQAFAANTYTINGVKVKYTDVSSSPNECWKYANAIYKKIWGTNFTSYRKTSDDMLRNLTTSELTLTREHLKEYISAAQPGASLRFCNSQYLNSNDGWGHSQILVAKSANGFTVFHGGLSSYDYRAETTYTWDSFMSSYFGKNYAYIKYIKWPGAPAYKPGSNDDKTAPVISNVKISNVTVNGYTVSFTAADNVGVTKTSVKIWTSANGQDDLKVYNNASKSGNNYTLSLNIKDHGFQSGTYVTRIYAYDAAGNETCSNAADTNVPADPSSTIVVSDKIMLTAVNGSQWSDTGAYVWTQGTFKAVWWRVLAAVPDVRNYKVTAIYEPNTGSKNVDPPSGGFLIAVHTSNASYEAASKVKVGDRFMLYGVNGTSLLSGAYAGFGEIQSELEAKQLVPLSSSKIKLESGNLLSDVSPGLTVSAFFGNFKTVNSAKKIFDLNNKEVTDGFVGTGCTVKLLDSAGKELNRYTVMVLGDTDGDGKITMNDYTIVKVSFKSNAFALGGVQAKAADMNGDGRFTTSDYIAIKRYVQGSLK